MTLRDSVFAIFEPFATLQKGDRILITTYGIAPPEFMTPVIKQLQKASQVWILVGYTKKAHDMEALRQWIWRYQFTHGFDMFLWPNQHTKIWAINKRVWSGSHNFVNCTSPNFMAEVQGKERERAFEFLESAFTIAARFSRTTKLELVPTSSYVW